MALKFQIGEIAHFFDIPASTLRYWEDKGVLHPEKGRENRYREYTIEDLMTISDVVFYKNLGLQLKEIREMDGSSPEQHGKLFTEKLSELEQQQELLARRIKKLRCHIQAVKTLTDLREHPYQKSDIDTECIVSFDLIERDKLCQYIEDPYLYSRVQHTQTLPQERRGLTISAEMCSAFPESSILWQKQSTRWRAARVTPSGWLPAALGIALRFSSYRVGHLWRSALPPIHKWTPPQRPYRSCKWTGSCCRCFP